MKSPDADIHRVEREEHPDDLEIKLAIPLPETAEHHSGHLIINVQSLTSKKILAVYSSSHAIRLRIEDDKALVSLDAGRVSTFIHEKRQGLTYCREMRCSI